MSNITELLTEWKQATADLPWGVQRQFLETLKLAAEEKITLAHSADYSGNYPCLVNANAVTLESLQGKGGSGKPGRHFTDIVRLFDSINSHVDGATGKTGNKVSAVAAETLVRNFGELKTVEQASEEAKAVDAGPPEHYLERSDDDLMQDWLNSLKEDGANADANRVDAESAHAKPAE